MTLVGDGEARWVNCESVKRGRSGRSVTYSNTSRRRKKFRNRKINKNNSFHSRKNSNRRNQLNNDDDEYFNDETQMSGCDGHVKDARLIAPVALASGKDGSIYVGDYNYIRMLSSDWQRITNILKLRFFSLCSIQILKNKNLFDIIAFAL